MQPQPNFNKLKTLFFNFAINTNQANYFILLERRNGLASMPTFHKRREQFKRDLTKWIDYLDIRSSVFLIDALNKHGVVLPEWMKNKNFTIEYNDYEHLDLIKK